MSTVVDNKTIQDYIANLSQRVSKLETGGKPLASLSPTASGSFTISGGSAANDIAITLSWTNPGVQANPKGTPQFTIYVDNDNTASYEWPFGSSLSTGQRNFRFDYFFNKKYNDANLGKNRITLRMVNQDGSSHTYYLKVNWIVLKGGSGSG